jgi:hypothetical protein
MAKVHKEPRFSVNKLGEYMFATASRRKKIIEDQKYPNSFIVSGYKEAREAIVKYIIKDYDTEILDDAIESISNSVLLKENEKENSILALREIASMNLPDLSLYKKTRYKGDNTKIKIQGLDISVNPDIILRKGNKVGCIKLHVIKSEQNRLTKDASSYVATLLQIFVDKHVVTDEEVSDLKICLSVDCFSKTYEEAPKSVKRRLSNIDDACDEIVGRWDSI